MAWCQTIRSGLVLKNLYNNKISSEQYFKVPVPLLNDSLIINIPIKNKIGNHSLTVVLDSANSINEIYKTDNKASVNFIVYSLTFRSLFADQYYNSFNGNITLLNPSYNTDTANSKFEIQIDTTKYFISPIQYEQKLSSFTSSILPQGLLPLKRYWWRVKLQTSPSWFTPGSFTNINSSYQWFINNPIDSSVEFNYLNAGLIVIISLGTF